MFRLDAGNIIFLKIVCKRNVTWKADYSIGREKMEKSTF